MVVLCIFVLFSLTLITGGGEGDGQLSSITQDGLAEGQQHNGRVSSHVNAVQTCVVAPCLVTRAAAWWLGAKGL